jgi:crotonobetainyl-CoA:carnitine CoA-transferase CaiB-like acyl-CoA transferase
MISPLQGIKVIDFTRVLAGPHCTKTLRDLGADVIKIEPPAGDVGRGGQPIIGNMSLYFTQQNAGKRNLSLDLNWPKARTIVRDLCRDADVIVENFRPGTLARFSLGYDDVVVINPRIVYVSLSGYGQTGPWRNRPAFAPTVQAETGLTHLLGQHHGAALTEIHNDPCSHADIYTGLHGVVAVLAALRQRTETGQGQHVDVAMAAVMLSVNERAGALMSGIDVNDEPLALGAPESPIFTLADGTRVTIAATPVGSATFPRYCAMMRRSDLLADPRFATSRLRRQNLGALLAEVRAWVLTFRDLDALQAQVSESNLAIGVVRSTAEFADTDWAAERGVIDDINDRAGGTVRMPGPPWRFSGAALPAPGAAAFQGEHNTQILREQGISDEVIADLRARRVVLSRRAPRGAYD